MSTSCSSSDDDARALLRAANASTAASLEEGRFYCWGSNMNGQLGAGLPKGSAVQPVEVSLP